MEHVLLLVSGHSKSRAVLWWGTNSEQKATQCRQRSHWQGSLMRSHHGKQNWGPVAGSVNSPGCGEGMNHVEGSARESHQEQRRRGWTQSWRQATVYVWGVRTGDELPTVQVWGLLRKKCWRPGVSGGPLGAWLGQLRPISVLVFLTTCGKKLS